MDSTMSNRFRQQVCFAVAAHMYVTTLLIYGWPFDSSVKVPDPLDSSATVYSYANKIPLWFAFRSQQLQPWMTDAQRAIFIPYKVSTCVCYLL